MQEGRENAKKETYETWSKVNGNESFSDDAFIIVTALSITLFSAETWNAVGASFLYPAYALDTCCARQPRTFIKYAAASHLSYESGVIRLR